MADVTGEQLLALQELLKLISTLGKSARQYANFILRRQGRQFSRSRIATDRIGKRRDRCNHPPCAQYAKHCGEQNAEHKTNRQREADYPFRMFKLINLLHHGIAAGVMVTQ